MKKFAAFALVFVLLFGFAACKGNEKSNESGQKFSIVCTTFPIYDWMRNIVGENSEDVKLTLLLDNGIDLHNYQATADDIITIHNSDMFIYVGGESDKWVEEVIQESDNDDLISISLIEALGDKAKIEEEVEGMEEEEEEEEPQTDEHVWLSLKNAQVLVDALSNAVIKLDSVNAEAYKKNKEEYKTKLVSLDKQFEEAAANGKKGTLLFGDRFPFRYLCDDYGLKYYAAFAGCSAETEASFETISFLANKVKELELSAVIAIDGSDCKIAETIAASSGRDPQIILMNSMQAVTKTDVDSGTTYLKAMVDNLQAVKDALV